MSTTPGGHWFFRKRVCPVPTWRTWLIVLISGALLIFQCILSIHPFLAISDPVQGDILVVEGWLPDHAMTQALTVFRSGGYRLMATTGEPLVRGAVLSEYGTYADLGAAILRGLGAGSDSVVAVPALYVPMNRTYAAAVALRKWLDETGRHPAGVDVISLGAHARRSRYLFRIALDGIPVGVIAVPDPSYDSDKWWNTSQGLQTVIEESVGYLYSLVHPPQ